MGYDFHITRKKDWSDEEGSTITREEVVALIERCEDLRVNEEYSNDEELMFVWSGSINPDWVMHIKDSGELMSKNPSEGLIGRMWLIAQELGACLQGDDGEIYRQDGSSYSEDENEVPREGVICARSPASLPKNGLLSRIFGRRK